MTQLGKAEAGSIVKSAEGLMDEARNCMHAAGCLRKESYASSKKVDSICEGSYKRTRKRNRQQQHDPFQHGCIAILVTGLLLTTLQKHAYQLPHPSDKPPFVCFAQVFEAEADLEEAQAVRDLRAQARAAKREAEAMDAEVRRTTALMHDAWLLA
eukprot:scaffold33797_cov20-Tisochrysis_lutea.AAC.1